MCISWYRLFEAYQSHCTIALQLEFFLLLSPSLNKELWIALYVDTILVSCKPFLDYCKSINDQYLKQTSPPSSGIGRTCFSCENSNNDGNTFGINKLCCEVRLRYASLGICEFTLPNWNSNQHLTFKKSIKIINPTFEHHHDLTTNLCECANPLLRGALDNMNNMSLSIAVILHKIPVSSHFKGISLVILLFFMHNCDSLMKCNWILWVLEYSCYRNLIISFWQITF